MSPSNLSWELAYLTTFSVSGHHSGGDGQFFTLFTPNLTHLGGLGAGQKRVKLPKYLFSDPGHIDTLNKHRKTYSLIYDTALFAKVQILGFGEYFGGKKGKYLLKY